LTTEIDFRDVLASVRELVPCDVIVLLRLVQEQDDQAVLEPVAADGLTEEALGRRFVASAHPRLERLLASGPDGLRFAGDVGLPDPYDGLLEGQPTLLAVHDCLGMPVYCDGQLWGLVTLDALDPRAFESVGTDRVRAVVRLFEFSIAARKNIQELTKLAAHAQAVVREQGKLVRSRELIGKSSVMSQLRREIQTVAASDLSVLILGETGVGKELVANQLHFLSTRQAKPLVQINCAALPETLADSELFGHKRGAFTGAVTDRIGMFELADEGTLFLDEIGELPLAVQAKLLRALQTGEIQRPGSDRIKRVNVRVIAATNRDLNKEVSIGRFRSDLYHRISVYPLQVPPLRERGRDVLTLAEGFLEENQHRLGGRNLRLEPEASAALMNQPWPGNVRELEHLISRAALRAWSEQTKAGRWIAIREEHLGLIAHTPLFEQNDAHDPLIQLQAFSGKKLREATDTFQRHWIQAALARNRGSLASAAREAGMDRSNFSRLAKRLGLLSIDRQN
jgi:anaerobic nitric oxide reductase transcription regulator